MHESIKKLKLQQLVWQASDTTMIEDHISTGFSELDHRMAGGYPAHGVIEFQSIQGIGELRLLWPYLKQSSDRRLNVFIQPPAQLCAESLQAEGINTDRILIVDPQENKHSLWAAEQCLKSGACANVFLWHQALEVHHIRRLQTACDAGLSHQFLFTLPSERYFSLPVTMSLHLTPHPQGLNVTIKKRRGGWNPDSFLLNFSDRWPDLTTQVDIRSPINSILPAAITAGHDVSMPSVVPLSTAR
jgi:cell division inhibitor SulA